MDDIGGGIACAGFFIGLGLWFAGSAIGGGLEAVNIKLLDDIRLFIPLRDALVQWLNRHGREKDGEE